MKLNKNNAVDAVAGQLPGVHLIKPRAFPDARGSFMEMYHAEKYAAAGIRATFVQDNFSVSSRHVLRGLHYQRHHPQAKLVGVLEGEIWDVIVDIRPNAPTRGQWEAHTLSSTNHHQLFVPEGFAHGFVVTSEKAAVLYKTTDFYRPDDEGGIVWNDETLAIPWPVQQPVVSGKDAVLPCLSKVFETL